MINNLSLSFSQDYKTILIKPYNDLILTQLFENNKLNERIEKIHYSLTNDVLSFPYDCELIQTYVITNKKVSNSDYNKYLMVDQPENYIIYGTFLNALSILWLSDTNADSLSGNFSVNWIRNEYVSVLAGYSSVRRLLNISCIMDNQYYTSISDPNMGRVVTGDTNNVKGFRFMNSLILSEIEHMVMQRESYYLDVEFESPVSKILGDYLNGESIEIIFDDDYNTVNIKLENNDNYYIAIDLETGLAYPITYHENQIYKGIHETGNGCNVPISIMGSQLHDALKGIFGVISSFTSVHSMAGTVGGLAISAGFIATGPLGWGVGLGLIASGVILNAYSSGLFENNGYQKTENLLDFAVGTGLSFMGGSTGNLAKNAIKSAISNSVSKKNVFKTFYKPDDFSSFVSGVKEVYTSTLGETKQEQAKKVLVEHFEGNFESEGVKFVYNSGKEIIG